MWAPMQSMEEHTQPGGLVPPTPMPRSSPVRCRTTMAQTGKALSSPEEPTPSPFGERCSGPMAAPTSEAEGSEPQEELPPIICKLTSCSSHGGSRVGDLGRSLAEAVKMGKALSSPALESEAGGYPQEELLRIIWSRVGNPGLSPAEISFAACAAEVAHMGKAALESEAGGEPQEELLLTPSSSDGEGKLGNLWRCLANLDLNSRKRESKEVEEQEPLVYRNPSQATFDAAHIHTSSSHGSKNPEDESMISWDQKVLKSNANYRRHSSPVSEDIQGPSGLTSANGEHEKGRNETMEGSLKEIVERKSYLQGKEFKRNWFDDNSDDESSSGSTNYSDCEDFLKVLIESRRPNYQHMPPEEITSLPEIYSLDLQLQFPSNQEIIRKRRSSSGSGSSSSSRSSSSNSSICLDRGIIWLATDEEEEVFLAEVSVCVADDLEAVELIHRHDEEELSRLHLGQIAAIKIGVPREILLEQRIIFFAKEKYASSCAICIKDFATTDRCIRLQCKHMFHFKCIIQWLLVKSTCPVCRGSVSEIDS